MESLPSQTFLLWNNKKTNMQCHRGALEPPPVPFPLEHTHLASVAKAHGIKRALKG
jgi:hypothetical protein